ncbi:hypothetical protein Syun_014814 [Stephania yunnanensis]|uniref:Uncharacterized protein n=1 Tax=Stephania yunnanensis TaxID=152371 RepID=A0AAP0JKI5_9MAGN
MILNGATSHPPSSRLLIILGISTLFDLSKTKETKPFPDYTRGEHSPHNWARTKG